VSVESRSALVERSALASWLEVVTASLPPPPALAVLQLIDLEPLQGAPANVGQGPGAGSTRMGTYSIT